MKLAFVFFLFALAGAAVADVTGKWQGKLTAERADGTAHEDTTVLILEQKGTDVAGTLGGKTDRPRHRITKGTIDGKRINLVATTNDGHEFHLALTLEDDELKGTIRSGPREANLHLKREKD